MKKATQYAPSVQQQHVLLDSIKIGSAVSVQACYCCSHRNKPLLAIVMPPLPKPLAVIAESFLS